MVLNRNRQKEYLEQFYHRAGSHLIVMYGAKGTGKTKLLREFMENKSVCYYKARPCSEQEQLRLWSSELQEQENGAGQSKSYVRYEELFGAVTELGNPEEKLVLVIQEFQNLVKNGTCVAALVQLLHHAFSERNVLIVLCCSNIGWVENSMVTRMGEAAFEIAGFLKIREFGFEEMYGAVADSFSQEEALALYSILGGIPGYWRYLDLKEDVKANLCRLLLETDGALEREARELVERQLRETSVYHTILSALADGNTKLNDLHRITGFSRAKISVYLKNLMELEIVEKVFSFDSEGRENTQKGVYRISNHLVDFYFRFIYPHMSALSLLTPEEFFDQYIAKELEQYTMECFGAVCVQYVEQELQKGTIPILADRSGEWVGKKGKLDYVAQEENGKTLVVSCYGETSVMPYEKYEECLESMQAAKLKADELYLFARDGFDKKIEEVVVENEKVHMVAWRNLYL